MFDIEKLIKEMTIEEKASLCSGLDNWRTKEVGRLGLRSVKVADGPSGMRVEDEKGGSLPSTCYPTGSTLSSTFNPSLAHKLGNALGIEARSAGLSTLLGPAVNIKRTPRCGRNFEYLSEDPLLSGKIAAQYSKGVQEENVGVSPKHFACNNQEYMRMSTSVEISERAMREIYFPAFEMIVKEAKPWTVMCSYNRINGVYSSRNKWLLTDVLRSCWGFDGIVMTDWGAVSERVESLKAGCELEMPSSHGVRDREIVEAVKNGSLDENILNEAVRRLLEWIGKAYDNKALSYDKEKHHRLAVDIAIEGAVLLKNQDDILPLDKNEEVILIGPSAEKPRFQGGGSSKVNPYRVTTPLRAMSKYAFITYYKGWEDDGITLNPELEKEALYAIKDKKNVVIFSSLPDSFESEGFDRHSLSLPSCQLDFIEKATKINKNCIIVLFNGSAVTMPFKEKAKAIIEMNLPGEGVGEALSEILFGINEPSGRLSETYPLCEEDTPSYLYYPGDGRKTFYGEDIFVGYRYYDTKKMDVLFPFGHGLGYTTFELSNIRVEKKDKEVEVTVNLKNRGKRKGKTVVQLYVGKENSTKMRPSHELRAFEKVELERGEERDITFTLTSRDFSYWEERIHSWYVESGTYRIEVGFSSRDISVTTSVELLSSPLPLIVDEATTISEVIKSGKFEALGEEGKNLIKRLDGTDVNVVLKGEAAEGMVMGCPLHCIYSYSDAEEGTLERIEEALKKS